MAAAADADAGGWKKGLKWGLGLCIPHTGCCCMNMLGAGSMVLFFNAVYDINFFCC